MCLLGHLCVSVAQEASCEEMLACPAAGRAAATSSPVLDFIIRVGPKSSSRHVYLSFSASTTPSTDTFPKQTACCSGDKV